MKSKDISISIIIPNRNGIALLKKYLPSVIQSVPRGTEIIVVDNNSSDGSFEYLTNFFPQVKLIKNDQRLGYATSVNIGVSRANGDIVILLNTDVKPRSGFWIPLVEHFRDKQVFAVGCMDISHENGQTIMRGRGIAWWEKGFYIHKRGDIYATQTAWVSGGSGAFRRQMWQELNGMNEIYDPFYWEDIDISYRAMQKGWKLVFEPKSQVDHYHEQGSIMKDYSPNTIKRIAYRNQLVFIWKNASLNNLLGHLFWLPVRLSQAVYRKDMNFIIAFIQALIHIPIIFK